MDVVIENKVKVKKSRRTLLRKEGKSNVTYRGIENKNVKYMKDLYVTLIDLKWRWALLILFLGFFLTQLMFSVVYYLLSYFNGDLDHVGDSKFQPCISNLHSYWDALLFSMETQSTVGYGTIYPNAECGGTVPVVYLQIIFGVMLETILLGFIFVKIARPKHRRHTIMFSRNACICLEDQQLTLQLRVGDIRNSHLIDCHVYGALVNRYVNQEKHVYPLFQHELEFEAQGMRDKLYLIWPMVLCHKITAASPLYTLTPDDLQRDTFELIIILEGTIESTGEMVQARTSFTSRDILWGQRLVQLEEYDEKSDKWFINFVRFHEVEMSETPLCSAKELSENPRRSPGYDDDQDFIINQLAHNSTKGRDTTQFNQIDLMFSKIQEEVV
uniref:Inward rectifier potassium channel C-terminal domain-containing protein n=1 Tax=Biomphalaria glabrata TaxID=6526 RepID=A0A2C9LU16_BIOGL